MKNRQTILKKESKRGRPRKNHEKNMQGNNFAKKREKDVANNSGIEALPFPSGFGRWHSFRDWAAGIPSGIVLARGAAHSLASAGHHLQISKMRSDCV